MKKYVFQRIIFSIITFFFIITLVFFLARATGDPLAELENDPRISPETIQKIRAMFGLDKPLYIQYIDFITNMMLKGEFGYSIIYKRPVMEVINERLPYTLALLIPAITLSNYLAYKIGVEIAWRRRSKIGSAILAFSIIISAVPYFWLALLFLYIFSVRLGWTPIFGAVSPGMSFNWSWEWFADYLYHYALPFTVLVFRSVFSYVLYVRNTAVDILGEDYVNVAMAMGLSPEKVKYDYVAKNALLPIVTVLGLRYAFLIDGAILTETVFSYPGTGRLVFEAIYGRDFWLLQGATVILALSVIIVNLVIDFLYMFLDPRVRYR
ncbi:MAG: ABC transporter permease subunit [Desulfurococcales archaeon]|nr:ABC transporter permease subunit [Desulfurococcales archaeon]